MRIIKIEENLEHSKISSDVPEKMFKIFLLCFFYGNKIFFTV